MVGKDCDWTEQGGGFGVGVYRVFQIRDTSIAFELDSIVHSSFLGKEDGEDQGVTHLGTDVSGGHVCFLPEV